VCRAYERRFTDKEGDSRAGRRYLQEGRGHDFLRELLSSASERASEERLTGPQRLPRVADFRSAAAATSQASSAARSEQALVSVVREAHVASPSMRKVDKVK
jgi:hypothetical protein